MNEIIRNRLDFAFSQMDWAVANNDTSAKMFNAGIITGTIQALSLTGFITTEDYTEIDNRLMEYWRKKGE